MGIASATLREPQRISQAGATANSILQKLSGACVSTVTAAILTCYCPPIFTSSTKVSEYQERVTYWLSQNQQAPPMDTLRQAERGSSLFELHSRTQH